MTAQVDPLRPSSPSGASLMRGQYLLVWSPPHRTQQCANLQGVAVVPSKTGKGPSLPRSRLRHWQRHWGWSTLARLRVLHHGLGEYTLIELKSRVFHGGVAVPQRLIVCPPTTQTWSCSGRTSLLPSDPTCPGTVINIIQCATCPYNNANGPQPLQALIQLYTIQFNQLNSIDTITLYINNYTPITYLSHPKTHPQSQLQPIYRN